MSTTRSKSHRSNSTPAATAGVVPSVLCLSDLQDKTVQFKIPDPNDKTSALIGTGSFLVNENRENLLSVQIVSQGRAASSTELCSAIYQIPQEGIDKIAKHSDPKIADFLLDAF